MFRSSFAICFLCFTLLLPGCRKADNSRVPDIIKVPIPLLTLHSGSDTKISGQKPEAFHASFTVDVYFQNGEAPKQLDLVVVKNANKANPRYVIQNITNWPIDVQITGQLLMDLFSEPIAIGDFFELSTDVTTQDGKRFLAFPAGGIPYGEGIYNLPGSSPMLRFAAPCPFNVNAYNADFVIVRDDWGDYIEDEQIVVRVMDSTHLSFKYKADGAVDIIMEIDTSTNSVTVAHQKYGTYNGEDFFVESIAGENSEVDPCTTSISVDLRHSTVTGSFDGVIVMTKR